MTERAWRDAIVGDRMRVDQEFIERVHQSGFSNQEWSLIMTAVDLEVEGTGEQATLVADTSHVPDIMPELDRINQQLGPYGGGSDRGRGGGGFVDSLKASLGLGGGSADEETVREAEQLASAYAAALESHLRENGKWDRVLELR